MDGLEEERAKQGWRKSVRSRIGLMRLGDPVVVSSIIQTYPACLKKKERKKNQNLQ